MSNDDRYRHGEPLADRTESDTTGDPGDLNRRRFLRTAAAAGAVSAAGLGGLSGNAAAKPSNPEPKAVSTIDIEAHLQERTGTLLGDLAADGVLSDGEVDELSTEPVDLEAALAGREGVTRFEYNGREILTSVTRTEAGLLTLRVEPQRDLAYAILDPEDDDGPVVYKRGGVGTAASCPGCSCSQLLCDSDGTRALICEVEYNGDCILLTRCGC